MTTPHRTLQMPNAGEVICPNCAHQFRAIPENVQSLLLASGHEPPFTASPAAPVPDGWVMAPREPTPEMIAAMPYPANTIPAVGVACYRAMITASPAAPAQPVPLTDEQIRSMWKSSEFRGNGGQADWFCEGIRAAEAHLGITGGKP